MPLLFFFVSLLVLFIGGSNFRLITWTMAISTSEWDICFCLNTCTRCTRWGAFFFFCFLNLRCSYFILLQCIGKKNTSYIELEPTISINSRDWDWELSQTPPYTVAVFNSAVTQARWDEVFSTVAHLLLVWHFALSMRCEWLKIEYNPDTFRSILTAMQPPPPPPKS